MKSLYDRVQKQTQDHLCSIFPLTFPLHIGLRFISKGQHWGIVGEEGKTFIYWGEELSGYLNGEGISESALFGS